MEDGVLNHEEESRLQSIAEAVGSNLPQFARSFFQSEGEGLGGCPTRGWSGQGAKLIEDGRAGPDDRGRAGSTSRCT